MSVAMPEARFVFSRDGTRISYRRVGEGPPVVVIHGGLGSWRSWWPVAEVLADRYEFFLVDRRGRGGSGRGPEGHALEHEVPDVQAVVAAAGPDATLVGHSYGGPLVLEAARLAEQGEIGRLVVYEPGLSLESRFPQDGIDRLHALVADGDLEGAFVDGLRQMTAAGGIRQEEADAAIAAKPSPEWDRLVEVAWTLPREIDAVARTGWGPERFAEVAVPTLVILGALSLAPHRTTCTRLASTLPNVRLVELQGQGHVAPHRRPPSARGGSRLLPPVTAGAFDELDRLSAIEAIKGLKARYCRFVDTKQWREFRALFTVDARFDFPSGASFESPDAFVQVVCAFFEHATSVHHCHNPEIEPIAMN